MFDKCETIQEVLKRFLELSRTSSDHQIGSLLIEICANRIITQFREKTRAELFKERKEESASALDENVSSRNPLLGNHETHS